MTQAQAVIETIEKLGGKPGLYALETHRKQLEQDGIKVQTDGKKQLWESLSVKAVARKGVG